jgi:hemolysin activation/secretion protein
MIRMHLRATKSGLSFPPTRRLCPALCLLLVLGCWKPDSVVKAAEPAALRAVPHFDVEAYVIQGRLRLPTNNSTASLFSQYTGPNISLDQIAQAAANLQAAYLRQGDANVNIVISSRQITNGVVTMDVFEGAFSQIIISGVRYPGSTNAGQTEIVLNQLPIAPAISPASPVAAVVPTHPPSPAFHYTPPSAPATPAEMAKARTALMQTLAGLTAKEQDRRIHVVSTNAGPRFAVENYIVMGNSVLSPATISRTMTNIDGAYGTNVSLDGIRAAVTELQKAYRARGYVTVAVGLPQQKLTNATVKIQVVEGRLADIKVKGNFYFSSNNVMRALPSLHTNMVLNVKVFEAELNRANANQDRQIYPIIAPGPDPGTSDLALNVKDRLPLHVKVDYNNQSSPGTPDLRLNISAVYNNLWDLEHSLGVQYSFSPGYYKDGSQWPFYDQPLVANYSAYYRMPLGNPVAIGDVIASKPGSFGYDEATRKFNLPPSSGQPELNFYASRSTIDTGLENLSNDTLYDVPNVESITENNVQQDLTINQDLGFRFSSPLNASDDFQSDFSIGLDYKSYQENSYKTNNFIFSEITVNAQGQPNPPIESTVASAVPPTQSTLFYLPFSMHYDGSWHDSLGTTALGLGFSVNTWFSGRTTTSGTTNNLDLTGVNNVRSITGSTESSGHWVTFSPSLIRDFTLSPGWVLTARADGQWASEPLISSEQFGAGGVNSVRGYREGDVFGDTGWHVSLEQQTPPLVVGMVYGNTPLTLRGSVYTDYARVFLLDPEGRQGSTPLESVGLGWVASVGTHWEARFLFSLPLLTTPNTEADHPFFNFDLTAQF